MTAHSARAAALVSRRHESVLRLLRHRIARCLHPARRTRPPSGPTAPGKPAAARTASATGRPATPYSGHGADSVPPEVLARFAPTPLPADVSRRIQSMLDVRAPVGGAHLARRQGALLRLERHRHVARSGGSTGRGASPSSSPAAKTSTRVVGDHPRRQVARRHRAIARARRTRASTCSSVDGGAAEGDPAQVQGADAAPVRQRRRQVGLLPRERRQARLVRDLPVRDRDGKRELVFAEEGLWSVDDHAWTEAPPRQGDRRAHRASTGSTTRRPRSSLPLFGQGEKEEYDAALRATPGEIARAHAEVRRLPPPLPRQEGADRQAALERRCDGDHAEIKYDVAGFTLDHAKTRILYYTVNEGGYTRLTALDARTFAPKRSCPRSRTGDHVTFGAPTLGRPLRRRQRRAARSAPTTSVRPRLADAEARAVGHCRARPRSTRRSSPWPTLEYYPARDGTKIPMFVRRPAACAKPRRSPARSSSTSTAAPRASRCAGFTTHAQLFVDAGFIFVEPNVRGSDGYGKTWLHADDGAEAPRGHHRHRGRREVRPDGVGARTARRRRSASWAAATAATRRSWR